MCRRAAWPGRFSEKGDNLEYNLFLKSWSKITNVSECIGYPCMTVTSFRLEIGDAVHDDMMKEQGFVVDLDVSGEQAAEVLHIPEQGTGKRNKHAHMLPGLPLPDYCVSRSLMFHNKGMKV